VKAGGTPTLPRDSRGGVIAVESGRPSAAQARSAVRELAERREYDAAALRITQRIRSSLALPEVLRLTVDELGRATASSRCLCQLAPNEDGVSRMIEWDRGDTRPLGLQPPTPVARRVFATGEPFVVGDAAALDDGDVRAYLDAIGTVAVVGYPIVWNGRVLACLGFQDSRPRSWHDHALPLLERCDGQLAAALVQADLFGQQQRALEELRNLTRMREELIANVSHELRTPLTAMLGSIKTLRREGLNLEQRDSLVAILDEQADRLARLTADLLDLSRFHRGERHLDRVRVRFAELARRAESELVLPRGRRLRVAPDDGVVLEVDPHRMLQVLANLLVNAVRHGAGDIHLSCFREDGKAVIHVSDDGEGIEQGFEDEVFLPFAHRSDRTDSTGLGLAIARAIVEAHGGQLLYLPPAAGRQHQFVIVLPRPADDR
jgi:K+-sensing histidine kinase KdpD